MNADELKRYFKEVPGRILQIIKAEGQMLGRMEVLVRLLSRRFGPLSYSDGARLNDANAEQLDAIADSVLTAQTLNEALSPLSR